jgi:hypothetical protein
MNITNDRVRAFQEAYKEDFGEEIPMDEAREVAERVLNLYLLLSRPLPSERATMGAKAAEVE